MPDRATGCGDAAAKGDRASDTVELFGPWSGEYASATSPHDSSALQRPASVARPTTAAAVAAVVREAAARRLRVVPQATGHGAGPVIDDGWILLDTSALDTVEIDSDTRTARVGAGAAWGRVNAEVERHGLLGLAGSASSVAVSGYTFGGD